MDTPQYETVALESDSVLLIQGVMEYGIDSYLYLFSEAGDTMDAATREIHIVPMITESEVPDSSTIAEFMFDIVSDDFILYLPKYETFSGLVKIFYTANRSILMTQYQVENGKASGPIEVRSPEGEVVISRLYEEGNCIASTTDFFATDWTFKPTTAELNIEKFSSYLGEDENGNQLIHLGESMHPNSEGYVNSLYAMIEKPVFENTFKVNGQPFTGTIQACWMPMVIGTPDVYYEISFLNGLLSDTFNLYNEYGELMLSERFENGQLAESIYQMEYEDGVAKPVIYLYPESNQTVHVSLDFEGTITHSYPSYPQGGWDVYATQNGTIYDVNKQEYYALFWEGEANRKFTYKNGFVIPGNETAKFLEQSLATLGLNRREANEFIMYWLPEMENNRYNLIHFSSQEYEQMADLKITPQPETIIRVMMVWSPLLEPIEIPQQDLDELGKKRSGFTVVEWGGKRQDIQLEN